jgi:hypothetical protein
MKRYEGVEVKLQVFLTSAFVQCKKTRLFPGRITLRNGHQYPVDRRLLGPRTGLDMVKNRKVPESARNQIPCLQAADSHCTV